eukprot:1802972-Amphidinium_carterae.1
MERTEWFLASHIAQRHAPTIASSQTSIAFFGSQQRTHQTLGIVCIFMSALGCKPYCGLAHPSSKELYMISSGTKAVVCFIVASNSRAFSSLFSFHSVRTEIAVVVSAPEAKLTRSYSEAMNPLLPAASHEITALKT